MIVLEIIAAILITLSLVATLRKSTRANLVRVRSHHAKTRDHRPSRDFFQH